MSSPGMKKVSVDLAKMASDMDLILDDRQLDQFVEYGRLLMEWNQRINLTAVTDPAEIAVRHFLDSLSCATVTGDLSGRRLVDVGTGAGFPGLPIKIFNPLVHLTLIESVAKKVRFLTALVDALELEDVELLTERAETIGHDPTHRASYDWAVARAVADMAVLAEYLLPMVRVGGRILAQKGKGAAVEAASAASALQAMGGGAPIVRRIRLPGRPEERYLVVVEKITVTPDKYPRRPGMPAKRPL